MNRTQIKFSTTMKIVILICLLYGFAPLLGQDVWQTTVGDSDSIYLQEALKDWKPFGHYPSGKFDTIKAEIATPLKTKNIDLGITILGIINGYIVREIWTYSGDRMPNGLPNNGGAYDDRFIEVKYLDELKREIKNVWMAKPRGAKSE